MESTIKIKGSGTNRCLSLPVAGAAGIFVEDQVIQIHSGIVAFPHICFSFQK